MKRAFTLIELIFTIVILSIVAYVASGLIAKTYQAYNQTNSISRTNIKLENALSIISNRLEYAISDTIVKRKDSVDTTLSFISTAPSDYEVLEWIAYDKDSFITTTPPAWSGFCDIKRSTQNTIITPGSNLDLADFIIKNLSNAQASLSLANTVALFFPENYNYTNIGFIAPNLTFNKNGIALIQSYTADTAPYYLNATLNTNNPIKRIVEQYKIAWSAYAVLPTNCNNGACDLELRYNYRPWLNEEYTHASSSLLATNVTVFKTYATENRVHIKLCIQDRYLGEKTISVCKEKVVYK